MAKKEISNFSFLLLALLGLAGTLFGLLSPNGSAGGTVVALLLPLTVLGGLLRNRRRRMDGK